MTASRGVASIAVCAGRRDCAACPRSAAQGACFRDCHSPLSLPAFLMLRPRKKYTVFDLQQLKGKRCLTHIHVKSSEEAAAAEEAGVDLMSCSFDSPEA